VVTYKLSRKWLLHIVSITVLFAVGGCHTEGEPQAAPPELPQQVLLTESMREQPVPGWTAASTALGLPPGAVVKPVNNIGDHGIFLGIADGQRWLFGLDVTSGEQLFGPVQLGTGGDGSGFGCVVNGPPAVLCIRQSRDLAAPSRAWVVDADSGEMIFDGTTEVRISRQDGRPKLDRIGDHAIATVTGKGIYGVGPHGELTWFVPGDGILTAQFAGWNRDTVPSELAVQNSGAVADVVFSVVDGRVVKPSVPEGLSLERAMVYPRGVGYEYTAADGRRGVTFFDDAGQALGNLAQRGALETRSADLPTVVTESHDRVMTLDGRTLVELPATLPAVEARLIGTRLFLANDPNHTMWQQFDLRTGDAGAVCETDALGFYFIASDGEVAVALNDDTPARAVDLATCEVLWSMPRPGPDEAVEVWKVGSALIRRTNDRISSLVAPG
jgi:hypothetical protein